MRLATQMGLIYLITVVWLVIPPLPLRLHTRTTQRVLANRRLIPRTSAGPSYTNPV